MNLLNDIITYIRRIIKSPSNEDITDNLLIDYINRFWLMDVDARIQLFDLKTTYQFQTKAGFDRYNMPLYQVQVDPGGAQIGPFPCYQGFTTPCYINGVTVPFYTEKSTFYNTYPNFVQQMTVVGTGDGTNGPYQLTFPITPNNATPYNPPLQYLIRGHVDITGIMANANSLALAVSDPIFSNTINTNIPTTSIYPAVYLTALDATGNTIVVSDSGQFLEAGGTNYPAYGLLMQPGAAPTGNLPLGNGILSSVYSTTYNTINYFTGVANVRFPRAIPANADISAQCYFFNSGLPRGILFENNTITLRSVPDKSYLVELSAYLSPAAFLNTANAIPFGYMAEYIARGAARKILSDTGDIEQLQFYEPFFREQEMLVWKRSQRQFTATRTPTIYSQGINQGQSAGNNFGGTTL